MELKFVVWSNEHKAFWAPNGLGYRNKIKDAGRYSRDHAIDVCRGEFPEGGKTPDEIMMLAPESFESFPGFTEQDMIDFAKWYEMREFSFLGLEEWLKERGPLK